MISFTVYPSIRQFICKVVIDYRFKSISFPSYYCPHTILTIKKILPSISIHKHELTETIGGISDRLYIYFNQFGELPDIPSNFVENYRCIDKKRIGNILHDYAYSVITGQPMLNTWKDYVMIYSLSKTIKKPGGACLIVANKHNSSNNLPSSKANYHYRNALTLLCRKISSSLNSKYKYYLRSIMCLIGSDDSSKYTDRVSPTCVYDYNVLSNHLENYLLRHENKRHLIENRLLEHQIQFYKKCDNPRIKCNFIRLKSPASRKKMETVFHLCDEFNCNLHPLWPKRCMGWIEPKYLVIHC